MNEKRFTLIEDTNGGLDTVLDTMVKDNGKFLTHKECCDLLNALYEENEQLKIALKDKENLINICEKKFKELGYLITCDDDGYVIE